jgi:hypothetical protein
VAPKSSVPERDKGGGQPVVIFQGQHKCEDGWTDYLVKQNLYKIEQMGSVHIKFDILKDSNSQRNPNLYVARSLLHEATHKVCDTYDHAYAHEGAKYEGIKAYEAIDNADSYAWAAVCFFKDNTLLKNAADGLRKEQGGQVSLR